MANLYGGYSIPPKSPKRSDFLDLLILFIYIDKCKLLHPIIKKFIHLSNYLPSQQKSPNSANEQKTFVAR